MTLSTYAGLKAAVASWTHRSDLTSYLDDIITVAETWIYRNARTRDMEAALSLTTASGVAALPSDFIAAKNVYLSGYGGSLTPMTADALQQKYPRHIGGGIPAAFTVQGSNMIFGPVPTDGLTVVGTYYKNLGAASSSAHALFTSNPDLYLYATLAECAPFLKQGEWSPFWVVKRDMCLKDANSQSQASRFGDGMVTSLG